MPATINVGGRIIKIGTWSLSYAGGNLVYRLEFNDYACSFSNIAGRHSGTGTFGNVQGGAEIWLGTNEGSAGEITVEKEDGFTSPVNPGGTGVGWVGSKVAELFAARIPLWQVVEMGRRCRYE